MKVLCLLLLVAVLAPTQAQYPDTTFANFKIIMDSMYSALNITDPTVLPDCFRLFDDYQRLINLQITFLEYLTSVNAGTGPSVYALILPNMFQELADPFKCMALLDGWKDLYTAIGLNDTYHDMHVFYQAASQYGYANEVQVMNQLQQFYDDYIAENYTACGNDMAQVLKGFGAFMTNNTAYQYGMTYSVVTGMNSGSLMPYTPGIIQCMANSSLSVNQAYLSFYQQWVSALVKAPKDGAKNASQTFFNTNGQQIYQQFEGLMGCVNETSDNSDLIDAYGMGYDPYDNTFQSKMYSNDTVWNAFVANMQKAEVPDAIGSAVGELFYDLFEYVSDEEISI